MRRWRKNLLDAQVSAVTVAKAYRLLKAIFNTAVDDGLIRRNPCRIKGADQEKSPERPVLTVPQVFALADAVGDRYRALVLLGVFSSLRWGRAGRAAAVRYRLPGPDGQGFRQLSEQRGSRTRVRSAQVGRRSPYRGDSIGDYTGPCLAHRDLCRARVTTGSCSPAPRAGR